MLLKKIYKQGKFDYLSLANTGTSRAQNFSSKLVAEFLNLGVMEIVGNRLTLHTHPQDLHYEILRTPGRYCLMCGEKLPDDALGTNARLHVATEHTKQELIGTGYEAINCFECLLDENEHNQWRVVDVARAPHFPLKES